MTPYPFDSIQMNGRDVSIQSILSAAANPCSDFEAGVFSFISDWYKGIENHVQYTSGSTGAPKPIVITRTQMVASAKMTEKALDLKDGYRALICLSPAYIAGKMMLVRSFVTGMKIIAVAPSANPFLNMPNDQEIDFAALVPYQVYEILRSPQSEYFHHIKTIIIGGASLDAETHAKIGSFSCRFYATYGMTETISHIALKSLNGEKAVEYYTTLPGVKIQVDDRGCLVITCNYIPDKIITNDLAEITGINTFKWLGRWDNVIVTGGFKVIPEKLEESIKEIFEKLNINQNFFVSSLPDPKVGNKVILVVEGSLNASLFEKLKTMMRENMPGHEIPKEVVSSGPFVFTTNGKINRKASLNHT